ncbi:MAG: hypothetical protein AB2693_32310 [Candidatus Thiodiazotropha sp.]
MARCRNLLYELPEYFRCSIIDRPIDGCDDGAMVHVPSQQRRVQKHLLCYQCSHKLLPISTLSAGLSQIVDHISRHGLDRHIFIIEQWAHLLKLWPQRLRDLNIHFSETEPLHGFKAFRKLRRGLLRICKVMELLLSAWHVPKHGGYVQSVCIVS